jgi:hypothetical protein
MRKLTTVNQVRAVSDKTWLSQENAGPKTLAVIRASIPYRGRGKKGQNENETSPTSD